MQTLRKVTHINRRDHIRNEEVCQRCKIQKLLDWVLSARNELNDHVGRMAEDRLARDRQQDREKGKKNHWIKKAYA